MPAPAVNPTTTLSAVPGMPDPRGDDQLASLNQLPVPFQRRVVGVALANLASGVSAASNSSQRALISPAWSAGSRLKMRSAAAVSRRASEPNSQLWLGPGL